MIGFKDPYDLEMAIRNDVIAKLFKGDYLPSYNFQVERKSGQIDPDPAGHIYNYQRAEAQLDWVAKIYLTNPHALGTNNYVGQYVSADHRLDLWRSHDKDLLASMTKAFTEHDPQIKVELTGDLCTIAYREAPVNPYDHEPSESLEVYCEGYDQEHEEGDHSFCDSCDQYHQDINAWHQDDYWCNDCERWSMRDDEPDLWCDHIREQEGITAERSTS